MGWRWVGDEGGVGRRLHLRTIQGNPQVPLGLHSVIRLSQRHGTQSQPHLRSQSLPGL